GGQVINLSASPGQVQFSSVAPTTDASGVATVTLTSTVAGNYTITGTASTGGATGTTAVSFIADIATASLLLAVTTADPTTVVANGIQQHSVRITLTDAQGSPLGGQVINLSASPGQVQFSSVAPTTDASGVATVTLTSTVAGSYTITGTASSGGSQGDTIVVFVADIATATMNISVITTDPSAIPADGVTPQKLRITLRDTNNNPIGQTGIDLTATLGAIITPSPAVTDANGEVIISVTSTNMGNVTIQGTANTNITAQADVAYQANVFFSRAELIRDEAVANGIDTNQTKIYLVGANGLPISGITINVNAVSSGLGVAGVAPGTLTSDADGIVIVNYTNNTDASVQLDITGPHNLQHIQPGGIFTLPVLQNTVLIASAPSDGVSIVKFEITLMSLRGEPVRNTPILITPRLAIGTTASGPSSAIVVVSNPLYTDENGKVMVSLTSTTSQTNLFLRATLLGTISGSGSGNIMIEDRQALANFF
ncbi:Ig-like domain-containing protein, partial [Yersinia enterocolitica]